jgi:hypothetical protein
LTPESASVRFGWMPDRPSRDTGETPSAGIRVVVTGETSGKAIVTRDEVVGPIKLDVLPGAAFYLLWGTLGPPSLPSDVGRQAAAWIPPVGGLRFGMSILPPSYGASVEELRAGLPEIRQKLPGLAEALDPDEPGMHATDTVDLVMVASGRVTLELDDGVEVHLAQGDCVVQQGSRHAWRNRATEACSLVLVMLGVARTPDA